MDSLYFDQEQWMTDAACAHHAQKELWFSDRPEDVEAAKLVCDVCYVKTECLEYALTNNIYEGVWGGFDQAQRLQLTRAWMVAQHRVM